MGRALQWDWNCPNLIFLAMPAGPGPGLHPACSRGNVQNAYQGRGVQSFLYSIKPFSSLVSCLYTLKHPLLLKLYQFLGGGRHCCFSFDLHFSVAFHLPQGNSTGFSVTPKANVYVLNKCKYLSLVSHLFKNQGSSRIAVLGKCWRTRCSLKLFFL